MEDTEDVARKYFKSGSGSSRSIGTGKLEGSGEGAEPFEMLGARFDDPERREDDDFFDDPEPVLFPVSGIVSVEVGNGAHGVDEPDLPVSGSRVDEGFFREEEEEEPAAVEEEEEEEAA